MKKLLLLQGASVVKVLLCLSLFSQGWVETGGGPSGQSPRCHQGGPHETSGPDLRGDLQRAEELPGGSPQGGVYLYVSSSLLYDQQPIQVCVSTQHPVYL